MTTLKVRHLKACCNENYLTKVKVTVIHFFFSLPPEHRYVSLMYSRWESDPSQDRVYAFYKEKNKSTDPYSERWTPYVAQICAVSLHDVFYSLLFGEVPVPGKSLNVLVFVFMPWPLHACLAFHCAVRSTKTTDAGPTLHIQEEAATTETPAKFNFPPHCTALYLFWIFQSDIFCH